MSRIALCPECGGEGSHEVPHPQRDDPFYCAVEQCRHCGGVGHVEEDGPPEPTADKNGDRTT